MAEYGDYINTPAERLRKNAFAGLIALLASGSAFALARDAWSSHKPDLAQAEWIGAGFCTAFAAFAIWAITAINARYTEPK